MTTTAAERGGKDRANRGMEGGRKQQSTADHDKDSDNCREGGSDDRVDGAGHGWRPSKQQSTNLACSFVPNNESKAGGTTATITAERGGINWGNDRVDRGAEWLRGNKHNEDKDNKQQRSSSHIVSTRRALMVILIVID